jgi:hypothetical protein
MESRVLGLHIVDLRTWTISLRTYPPEELAHYIEDFLCRLPSLSRSGQQPQPKAAPTERANKLPPFWPCGRKATPGRANAAPNNGRGASLQKKDESPPNCLAVLPGPEVSH